MRALFAILALALYALAVPAGLRAARAPRVGTLRHMLWESARCLLAVAAATALLVTMLRG
jgi:hypothetical protein